MSNPLNIEFKTRTVKKSENSTGRKEGWSPAVVYGPSIETTSIFVNDRSLIKLVKNDTNTLHTLNCDGEEISGAQVFIKSIDLHPTKQTITHIDFYKPDLTKKVRVEVGVTYSGLAVGVKEGGGLFEELIRKVEVECLPADIPSSIDVDVTPLAVGKSLKVGDMPSIENVKMITPPEIAIAIVNEPS